MSANEIWVSLKQFMESSRWERIKDAYADADGLAGSELDAYLANLPEDIRPDIENLLAADREAG